MFKVTINDKNISESIITTDIAYLKEPSFLCVIGSRLYGTGDEESDLDIRGFNFMHKEFLLGVKKFEQHQNLTGKDDVVVWSAEKFVKMLISGSTVAFEMLFCPDSFVITKSKFADVLIRNTNVFVSERVIKSILGYAQHEWRKVHGIVTRDLGEKRKKHIEAKGYSYKNAYHAIRILDSGIELAKHKTMSFPVQGAAFLKALKRGDVDYCDVEPLYNRSLKELESVMNGKYKGNKQDVDYINDLLCDLNFKNLIINEFA